VFGYDKYSEITREHAIRGTFCDLAIKLDNALALLIEVKAIGSELKDAHVKQAVDYAANQGCEWVILTNGSVWRTYKVQFLKPITQDMVVEFDLCQLSGRNESHLEMLGLIAKEGWQKANIGEYHIQRQALSRFSIAALILSDAVSDVLRRELRRLSKGIRVEEAELQKVLREEVLKRDAIEGEKADAARRMGRRWFSGRDGA
jgi:predicted type IV restriction endonuclease